MLLKCWEAFATASLNGPPSRLPVHPLGFRSSACAICGESKSHIRPGESSLPRVQPSKGYEYRVNRKAKVNWWFKRQAILADIRVALEHYDAYGLAERPSIQASSACQAACQSQGSPQKTRIVSILHGARFFVNRRDQTVRLAATCNSCSASSQLRSAESGGRPSLTITDMRASQSPHDSALAWSGIPRARWRLVIFDLIHRFYPRLKR